MQERPDRRTMWESKSTTRDGFDRERIHRTDRTGWNEECCTSSFETVIEVDLTSTGRKAQGLRVRAESKQVGRTRRVKRDHSGASGGDESYKYSPYNAQELMNDLEQVFDIGSSRREY